MGSICKDCGQNMKIGSLVRIDQEYIKERFAPERALLLEIQRNSVFGCPKIVGFCKEGVEISSSGIKIVGPAIVPIDKITVIR